MTLLELKSNEDVPVVTINEQGLIVFSNPKFSEVFGWSTDEATGQEISIIIPPELHDAHHMGFSRFLATEEPQIMGKHLTLKAINRKGDIFDAEHYIIGEKIDGHWEIGCSIKPL